MKVNLNSKKLITIFCTAFFLFFFSQKLTHPKELKNSEEAVKTSSDASKVAIAQKLTADLSVSANLSEQTNFYQPFIISGKGTPGATVFVEITPGFRAEKSKLGNRKPAEGQENRTTVNASGFWSINFSPVYFSEHAFDRSISISILQRKGLYFSQPIQRIYRPR